MKDSSNPNAKWTVKANLRHQPAGSVRVKLTVKNASLGEPFVNAGFVRDNDPLGEVQYNVPMKVEIAGRTFEVEVPTDFKFNAAGSRTRGTGLFED